MSPPAHRACSSARQVSVAVPTVAAAGGGGNLRIADKVSQVFAEAQTTKAVHRQLHAALRRLHHLAAQSGLEKDFNRAFVDCVNLVLAARSVAAAELDRLLDFVPAYVLFSKIRDAAEASAVPRARVAQKSSDVLQQPRDPGQKPHAGDSVAPLSCASDFNAATPASCANNSDDKEENDEQNPPMYFSLQFAVWLLRYLLNGVTAKDKHVRYRCLRLIYGISVHLTSIDDLLFSQMKTDLTARLYDKEIMVRREAVNALSVLQVAEDEDVAGEESISSLIIRVINEDHSAAVRKCAISQVSSSVSSVTSIVTRSADCDPKTRIAALKQLSCRFQSFLDIHPTFIISALEVGFKDKDPAVKVYCGDLLHGWVQSSITNLVHLLSLLNVLNCVSVSENIVKETLRRNPLMYKTFKFDELYWSNLTPETALIIRCVSQLYADIAESFNVSTLGYYLQYHTNRMLLSEDESLEPAYQFIVNELLTLCLTADYSDALGRQKMFTLLRSMVASLDIQEDLLDSQMDLLRILCVDERDYIRVVYEIINDLCDTDVGEASGREFSRQAKAAAAAAAAAVAVANSTATANTTESSLVQSERQKPSEIINDSRDLSYRLDDLKSELPSRQVGNSSFLKSEIDNESDNSSSEDDSSLESQGSDSDSDLLVSDSTETERRQNNMNKSLNSRSTASGLDTAGQKVRRKKSKQKKAKKGTAASSGAADNNEADATDDVIFRDYRCLLLLRKTLMTSKLGWRSSAFAAMHGLLPELVIPAFSKYSAYAQVLVYAIECLGLICITSAAHAKRFFPQFVGYAGIRCNEENAEAPEVILASLRVIFDIFYVFSAEMLELAPEVENAFLAVVTQALISQSRPMASLAAVGCARLYLVRKLVHPDILACLFIQFFSETPSHPECLDYFIEAFQDSFSDHADHLAAAFCTIIKGLCSGNTAVEAARVSTHATSILEIAQKSQTLPEDGGSPWQVRCCIELLDTIEHVESAHGRALFAVCLKLDITGALREDVQEMKELLIAVEDAGISESLIRNFTSKLDSLVPPRVQRKSLGKNESDDDSGSENDSDGEVESGSDGDGDSESRKEDLNETDCEVTEENNKTDAKSPTIADSIDTAMMIPPPATSSFGDLSIKKEIFSPAGNPGRSTRKPEPEEDEDDNQVFGQLIGTPSKRLKIYNPRKRPASALSDGFEDFPGVSRKSARKALSSHFSPSKVNTNSRKNQYDDLQQQEQPQVSFSPSRNSNKTNEWERSSKGNSPNTDLTSTPTPIPTPAQPRVKKGNS